MTEKKQDNIVKNALILFAITIIAGMLLGLTYEVTKDPIIVQNKKIKNAALQAVVTEADKFEPIETIEGYDGVNNIYAARQGDKVIAYAFEMTAFEGYGGNIELMVGVSIDDTILGIDIVKHSETPGLGAKSDEPEFKSEFVGEVADQLSVVKMSPSDNPGEISSISGATITSRSVTNAVNVACDYFNDNLLEVE